MDDRTTIAKDVLCALIRTGQTQYTFKCDGTANEAVAYADALLHKLASFQMNKPTPPPAAPKGPVWRKMSDKPNHTGHTIAVFVTTGATYGVCCKKGEWRWADNQMDEQPFFTARDTQDAYYWLDLNGFTPEVGE